MQYCVCTQCGRKTAGDELRFDLTDVIMDNLRRHFSGDRTVCGVLDALETRWKKERLGPTMISEKSLKKWADYRGLSPVRLTLSVSRWLSMFQSWIGEEDDSEPVAPLQPEADFSPSSGFGFTPFAVDDAQEMPLAYSWGVNISALTDALSRTAARFPDACLLDAEIYPHQSADDDSSRIEKFGMLRKEWGVMDSYTKRYCPHCGHPAPAFAGKFRQRLILVLGGRESGKSAVISACSDYFMPRPDEEKSRAQKEWCNIRWSPDEKSEDWQEFSETYLARYRAGERWRDMIPAALTVRTLLPETENSSEEYVTLTLAEFPFDAFLSETPDAKFQERRQNLCANADFIWLCADGRVLQADEDVLNQYLALLRKCERLFTQPQKPPAVFLLSKSDAIPNCLRSGERTLNLYDPDCRLDGKSGGIQAGLAGLPFVQMEDFYEDAHILREFIRQHSAPPGNSDAMNLIDKFEMAFPRHTYIASSAFGFNPAERTQPPRSCRAEWPFLWTLAVSGDLLVRNNHGVEGFAQPKEGERGEKGNSAVILENLCMSGDSEEECQALSDW